MEEVRKIKMTIDVDYDKCQLEIGCSDCIDYCQQGVLGNRDNRVEVINPEECLSCYGCQVACEYDALHCTEE